MRFAFVFLFLTAAYTSYAKFAHDPPAQEKPAARQPSNLRGNPNSWAFTTAVNRISKISAFNPVTVYCPCKYTGKVVDLKSCGFNTQNHTQRSTRIEWEHVAAAESFGQSFKMWREGDSSQCVHNKKGPYQGRKCAERDPEFRRMETDLYNLWPIIGELNALRSNLTMAQLTGSDYNFGNCKVKIQDRKFEPMDEYKGIVARTHMYMDWAYPGHGIISNKNQKLFEAWNKLYPVSDWECQRNDLIEEAQGNPNPIVKAACEKTNRK